MSIESKIEEQFRITEKNLEQYRVKIKLVDRTTNTLSVKVIYKKDINSKKNVSFKLNVSYREYQVNKLYTILFGLIQEKFVIKQLKEKYPNIKPIKEQYSPFDFIDKEKKIVFELKSVENPMWYNHHSYKVGIDKYKHFLEQYKPLGYKCILIYNIGGNILKVQLTKKKVKTYKKTSYKRFNNGTLQEYYQVSREDFKEVCRMNGYIKIEPLDIFSNIVELDFLDDDE